MEINLYIFDDWFEYGTIKTHVSHGLHNGKNIYLGYKYQDKQKGFWLTNRKR